MYIIYMVIYMVIYMLIYVDLTSYMIYIRWLLMKFLWDSTLDW